MRHLEDIMQCTISLQDKRYALDALDVKVTICNDRAERKASHEVFTTLTEAQILIKQWRKEYNQVRPHSALRYRPPGPEAILIVFTS